MHHQKYLLQGSKPRTIFLDLIEPNKEYNIISYYLYSLLLKTDGPTRSFLAR